MKFFFDENISHLIVEALRCLEHHNKPDFEGKHELVHTFHKYPNHSGPVADETYIREMSAEGYILLTADHAQKRNRGKHEVESQSYRDAKAIGFWLPRSFVNPGKKYNQPAGDFKFVQAAQLFSWWPSIKWEAGTAKPGDLFDINDRGKIERRI